MGKPWEGMGELDPGELLKIHQKSSFSGRFGSPGKGLMAEEVTV
jgi:hypothetical protein